MQRVAVLSFPFSRQTCSLAFTIVREFERMTQVIWHVRKLNTMTWPSREGHSPLPLTTCLLMLILMIKAYRLKSRKREFLPTVHPLLEKRAFKKAARVVAKLRMQDHLEMQDVSATLMFQEVEEGLHWAETERFVVRWKDVWSSSSEVDTFCFIFFPVLILTECVHGQWPFKTSKTLKVKVSLRNN